MSIRLTDEDIKNIQQRVDYVNDYFKDIWQTYESTMISQRRNYRRNFPKFEHMSDLIMGNHQYGSIDYVSDPSNMYASPDLLARNYRRISKANTGVTDAFKMNCNETRYECFQGYKNYLVGMLYNYLYRKYGKNVPDKLNGFLDYHSIYRDSHHIFTDLNRWWNYYVRNRSIADYTDEQEKIQKQREKVDFIKDTKRRMSRLVKCNDIERSSKRVVRVSQHFGKLGNHLDRLGSPTINSFLFWLAKYHGINAKAPKSIYLQYDFKQGSNPLMNNHIIDKIHLKKSGEFSITFRSSNIASDIYDLLIQYRYDVIYPEYEKRFHNIFNIIDERIQQTTNTFHEHLNYHPDIYIDKHRSYSSVQKTSNEYLTLNLLQAIFTRFYRSISQSDRNDFKFTTFQAPKRLKDAKEYWCGIQATLDALGYDPIETLELDLGKGTANTIWDKASEYQKINNELQANNHQCYYYYVGMINTIQEALVQIKRAICEYNTVNV